MQGASLTVFPVYRAVSLLLPRFRRLGYFSVMSGIKYLCLYGFDFVALLGYWEGVGVEVSIVAASVT